MEYLKTLWVNLKYLILTVVLFALLIPPFIIKLKNRNLEIFPSIIMPSGAGLIYKDELITFAAYELYAKQNGVLKKVEIKSFLAPIPEWYINHIAQSDFGFDSVSNEITITKFPITFRNFNRFVSSELPNVKTFYKKKLQKIGFDDSLFIYRNYNIQVLDSFKNKILVNEKTYYLK